MGLRVILKRNQVYIAYSAAGDRRLFAIRPTLKCEPQHLDTEGRIVSSGNRKKDVESTRALQNQYIWFASTIERLEKFENRRATIEVVAALYEESFVDTKSISKNKELRFWSCFDEFIETKRSEGLADVTINQYDIVARNRLSRFFESIGIKNPQVDQFDTRLLNKFKNFFINNLNLSCASYNHTISVFKMFMAHLKSTGSLTQRNYDLIRASLQSRDYENSKDLALTVEQLNALLHFNDLTPAVKRNLDYFICNCLLGGLRWQDFKNLTFGNINMISKNVSVHTSKTRKKVEFPVYDIVYNLIRKYNPAVDEPNQKVFKELNNLNVYNRSLKEAASKFYMIDEKGERVYPFREYRESVIFGVKKAKKQIKPLYEFFKSSMARRTFISVMRRAGYGFEETKVFTGHVNPYSYSKYCKLVDEDKILILNKVFGDLNDEEPMHMRIASDQSTNASTIKV
ncbi:tyrosine-type recombinase/integrase [Rufibacter ruber]|uniref:tyrosine-type recombinase/integrase n=1 Tax=Rufibacter ruber TaxID=1783499 RepID=UPI00137B1FA6|nr:tyrosine-type recombinase/integrase [Rufibacter ruber]